MASEWHRLDLLQLIYRLHGSQMVLEFKIFGLPKNILAPVICFPSKAICGMVGGTTMYADLLDTRMIVS